MGETSDQKTKPEFYKKWWFWVIIIVILGGAGAAIGGNSNGGSSDGNGSGTEASQDKEEKKDYKIGDVITTDDCKITVTKVERNYKTKYNLTPDDGKEYVAVYVTINNISNDKISYNVYEWSLEDGTGDIKSQSITADDNTLSSGELAAGGTKESMIIFEVPKDDKKLTVHYKPSIWSNKELLIKL